MNIEIPDLTSGVRVKFDDILNCINMNDTFIEIRFCISIFVFHIPIYDMSITFVTLNYFANRFFMYSCMYFFVTNALLQ